MGFWEYYNFMRLLQDSEAGKNNRNFIKSKMMKRNRKLKRRKK